MSRSKRTGRSFRRGTTAVETAFVLPVFLVMILALIEFGHGYMTVSLLKGAAREAARIGVADGKTNADVLARANALLSSGIDPSQATIRILDGSDFDETGAPPDDIDDLAAVDIEDLASRDLYIVRIDVPYRQVSLFPLVGWLKDWTITGQAVMRRE